MSERVELIKPLIRPLKTTDYNEHGPFDGPTLAAGTPVRVEIENGELCAARIDPEPKGEYDWPDALRAAAEDPCPHLVMETDERLGYPDYFTCNEFEVEPHHLGTCLGDRCRCPFKDEAAPRSD